MELVNELQGLRERVLCNLVLDKIAGWPFRRLESGMKRFLGLCLLFIIFEASELLVFGIVKISILQSLVPSILTAFIAALCIHVVSCCYQHTLVELGAVATTPALGSGVEKALVNWLRKTTNIWFQLLWSCGVTVAVILALYVIKQRATLSIPYGPGLLFGAGLVFFWLGQIWYWAVFAPFATRLLRGSDASEIGLDPLYPNETPILVAMSRTLSVYALWHGFVATLCLILLFTLQPDFGEGGTRYVLVFVLLSYLISFWTFLYPQFNLSQLVYRAKQDTLLKIRAESSKLYENLDKLERADFERLENLRGLHDTVSKWRNTVVGFSGLRSFIASLIMPALTAFVGFKLQSFMA
ncbi:hypothetical protein E3J62_12580 [candidate division TA06 bacterium]|uniref:Uncharacterized protein n=1 Tax=candidate division TA06 bacterium TaxID=2250710 RepID=A0A523UMQ1_UNCT6|nr:MAG: hypothetical protein E3J62_12580 [candidate division TA06 bacterium]